MEKRGVALFFIIEKWAKIVKQTVVKGDISWYLVPDYDLILQVVINEMAERPVSKYPDALIDASTQLLHNPKLLSMFTKILFKKTNVHSPPTVNVACNTIFQWFEHIHNNNSTFPTNFDFPFLFRGLEIMIGLDHAVVTTKSVWLLYKIIKMVPLNERIILVGKLYENFYHLFFHWSWDIRNIFHQLLVY